MQIKILIGTSCYWNESYFNLNDVALQQLTIQNAIKRDDYGGKQ